MSGKKWKNGLVGALIEYPSTQGRTELLLYFYGSKPLLKWRPRPGVGVAQVGQPRLWQSKMVGWKATISNTLSSAYLGNPLIIEFYRKVRRPDGIMIHSCLVHGPQIFTWNAIYQGCCHWTLVHIFGTALAVWIRFFLELWKTSLGFTPTNSVVRSPPFVLQHEGRESVCSRHWRRGWKGYAVVLQQGEGRFCPVDPAGKSWHICIYVCIYVYTCIHVYMYILIQQLALLVGVSVVSVRHC